MKERKAGTTAWTTRYPNRITGFGRRMPGTRPITGSQSTNPAASTTRSMIPRTTGDDAWASTSGTDIEPTITTVNTDTALTGPRHQSRTASTGAGRVTQRNMS